MGAARKRGTPEERKAAAIFRNENLKWAIENGKDPHLKRSLKKTGIRRVVAALVMSQTIRI